jgi:protein Tex
MDQTRITIAIAADLDLEVPRVRSAVRLFDEGNTIPFVARYRKELTGSLDEEQLRQVAERLGYRRKMESRRESILNTLEDQGVLTPELDAEVRAADTLQRLEDLYRPYRPKRQTRATAARDKGLAPVAERILAQPLDVDRQALVAEFLSEEVPTVAEAYEGARDIVAEVIADDPDVRRTLRDLLQRHGTLAVSVTDESRDPKGTYQLYYHYYGDFRTLRPHQILALNRGEREGILDLKIEMPDSEAMGVLAQRYPHDLGSPLANDLLEARRDGYNRLLFPAMVREVRSALTEKADAHAIDVFAENLSSLLLQPPLRDRRVIGIDPGYRTGCKVALVDATGRVLAAGTVYPSRDVRQAKQTLKDLVDQYGMDVIAIGNGTASRETEAWVAETIGEGLDVRYTIVSEAGASVYSASPLARAELPDLDVSLRGAVSIARRLQDPLAELVKIDPQAIGVGLYQHDVNQTALAEALDTVVESTVNRVGADLNTASPALLQYISGIGPKLAEAIVTHRDEHGSFAALHELRDVSGVGPKTFQQAAGFLRIPDGPEPLDNTPIHPESYEVAKAVLSRLGRSLGDPELLQALRDLRRGDAIDRLAAELEVGPPTLEDILAALASPGRDPRDALEGPVLRSDVLTIEDLAEGMRLKGTIRNVVDFGAFVDIGVKRNGLIHISQMGPGFVRDPHERVAVGDVVEVEVLSIDVQRGRIGLGLVL